MRQKARSIGDRLNEARRRAFVGRAAELELFSQALDAFPPHFSVLFVHGPGGIGKSTLLERCAELARAAALPVFSLDARTLSSAPESILRAIGADSIEHVREVLGERCLLTIDTYEELGALDAFLRESFVPALPEGAILVIAGRDPPSGAWRVDPGLASISRVRALRNLKADESAALLEARGVPSALRDGAHALTYGHPLALVLVAELARGETLPALTPDVVRALLERIVRALPDPAQRDALEIAAFVRVVTEPLLAELGVAEPARVFSWLRSLPFMHESGGEGVAPHDLVRDAIVADLAFRDPVRDRAVRDAIAARNHRAVHEASGRERERAFFDVLFAYRHNPELRRFYDWDLGRAGGTRPLRADEIDALIDEIALHEGDGAARIARAWWQRQPEAFRALLDGGGVYLGAVVYLRLHSIDRDVIDLDPALEKIAGLLDAAPLRENEHATVLRFWIWRDRYQAVGSAAHIPHSAVVALDWAFAVGLAFFGVMVQRVEDWRPLFAHLRLLERPEAAFAMDAHRFHVFARDFRVHPWTTDPHKRAGAAQPSATRVVLSQEDFDAAVREALRLATRPQELSSSPLLRSRLLADWAEDESPAEEMIPELLRVAASSLEDARDDRPRRCVELTYLDPAPTHEIAAERLGLSFSTYRRQLARGVERVVAYLWDREVRGVAR